MIRTVITLTAGFLMSMILCACDGRRPGTTEKGALGGAAIGAGLGAIVGHQHGRAGEGAAIGGAAGALTGGLIGHGMEEDGRDKRYRRY